MIINKFFKIGQTIKIFLNNILAINRISIQLMLNMVKSNTKNNPIYYKTKL